jgi:DNA-binding protein H-NS
MAKKGDASALDEALDEFKLLAAPDQQTYIKQLQEIAEASRQEAIAELMAKLEALGAPMPAKAPKRAEKGTRSAPRAKYRDPVSGAEWSGRGRAANWIVAYEVEGRSRDEFLIKD